MFIDILSLLTKPNLNQHAGSLMQSQLPRLAQLSPSLYFFLLFCWFLSPFLLLLFCKVCAERKPGWYDWRIQESIHRWGRPFRRRLCKWERVTPNTPPDTWPHRRRREPRNTRLLELWRRQTHAYGIEMRFWQELMCSFQVIKGGQRWFTEMHQGWIWRCLLCVIWRIILHYKLLFIAELNM